MADFLFIVLIEIGGLLLLFDIISFLEGGRYFFFGFFTLQNLSCRFLHGWALDIFVFVVKRVPLRVAMCVVAFSHRHV